MGRGDDLVGLLGEPPAPAVGFRQGLVTAWNANTGANTIQVGGSLLVNVPILNTGEAIALKAGHVVGLLTAGGSWFILGRITPSGDPNFAGASVAFANAEAFVQNFTVPAAFTLRASAVLTVPPWADEAAVTCMATATVVNSNAARQEVLCYAGINGGTGSAMATGIAPDSGAGGYGIGSLASTNTDLIVNPGPTIDVQCYLDSTIALAANGVNTATVNAIAIYRSTT